MEKRWNEGGRRWTSTSAGRRNVGGTSADHRRCVGRPSAVRRQTVGGMSAERRSEEMLTVWVTVIDWIYCMLTTLYIVICLTEESQVRPEQIDRTVKVAATPVHRRRRYRTFLNKFNEFQCEFLYPMHWHKIEYSSKITMWSSIIHSYDRPHMTPFVFWQYQ